MCEKLDFCDCGREDCVECNETLKEILSHEEHERENNYFSPIEIDKSNLMGIQLDDIAYQRGVNHASYVAGIFSALVNEGVSTEDAFSYIINMENTKHNLEIAQIKKEEATIVAKANIIKQETESI